MIDLPNIYIKEDDIKGSIINYFDSLDYENQQKLAGFCANHSWFVDSIITQNQRLNFWDISAISKALQIFFKEKVAITLEM